MSLHSAELACPAIRWLGVHPTDIKRLDIEKQRLNSEDVVRLKNMLPRPYIEQNLRLHEEVCFVKLEDCPILNNIFSRSSLC